MRLTDELCDRCVAPWNEPDPERRRAMVADLRAADAERVLRPPQDVRAAAAGLSASAVFAVRGHSGR